MYIISRSFPSPLSSSSSPSHFNNDVLVVQALVVLPHTEEHLTRGGHTIAYDRERRDVLANVLPRPCLPVQVAPHDASKASKPGQVDFIVCVLGRRLARGRALLLFVHRRATVDDVEACGEDLARDVQIARPKERKRAFQDVAHADVTNFALTRRARLVDAPRDRGGPASLVAQLGCVHHAHVVVKLRFVVARVARNVSGWTREMSAWKGGDAFDRRDRRSHSLFPLKL